MSSDDAGSGRDGSGTDPDGGGTDPDGEEHVDATDPDGGYVHTPNGEPGATGPDATEPAADGFGRKGWALTAALFVCVLVIPGIIYAYPYAAGSLGLSFFGTYLVLPLIPAALLGLIAVWAMTGATRTE